jgi:2EXR family
VKNAGKTIQPPSPPAPEPEFHLFLKFPIELRQEILSYLIPEGRTVSIWGEYRPARLRKEIKQAGPEAAKIPTPLLHVNKEIREFAMKWYTLSFAEQ